MFQKIIKWCIYALVFLMPLFWLPFSLEAYDINKAYLLAFLAGIGILAWVGKMIFHNKKIIFKRTALDFFVLGYLAILILSAIFAKDKTSVFLGFYGRFWPSILTSVSLVGFYFLITNNVSNDDEQKDKESIGLKKILSVFFAGCLGVVAVVYLSLLNVWALLAKLLSVKLPVIMTNRFFNTVGSLQGLAIFLAFVLTMLLAFLAFGDKDKDKDKEKEKDKKKTKVKQVAWYVMAFAILGLLAIINFWQAWFCLALALAIFLVLSFWKRMFKEDVQQLSLPILFLLLAIVFLFPNPLTKFLNQNSLIAALPKEAILSQQTSYQTAINGLSENPALGSGVGGFHYSFAKFKPASFLTSQFWQVRFDRAGNNISEMLATNGILGILGFTALFFMFFLVSYFHIKASDREKTSSLQDSSKRIPILIGFIALLVGQFFYYQTAVLGFSFWLILALGVVSWGKGTKEKKFSFKEFPEVGLLMSIVFWVMLLALAFLYFTLLRYYMADVAYRNYLVSGGTEIAGLEKAAKSNSFGPTYHVALASAYMQKLYNEAAKETPDKQIVTNIAASAIQEARKATTLGPNRVSTYEVSGVIYRDLQAVAQGALDWSVKSFESALKLEPLNPVITTEIGKLKLTGGFKDAAKIYFEKAMNMKKDFVESGLQLAMMDEAEGKTSDVLSKLEGLVQSAPFSVEARFQLARAYYNDNEFEKAAQQAQQALIVFPNHSNSLFLLGLAFEKMGERDLALQTLEKVLELNPNNQQVIDQISRIKKPVVIEKPNEEKISQ
ncbi:MAG: tetratricopeptide repeat protein [bacterium]|nr:tetratricopeptide repeat protein [bacterium]